MVMLTRPTPNHSLHIICAIAFQLLVSMPPLAAENVVQPRRVVAFDYPILGRRAHIEGGVELVVSVNSEGGVEHVKLRSGSEVLGGPAAAAVSRWTFSGCAATCEVKLGLSFVLEGEACRLDQNCPKDFIVDLPDHILIKSSPLVGSIN
jgi:Gram-negative bacterial TonB protein C-terminal